MSLITWSRIYEVDVPEIDGQHKKLVELLNKLSSASEKNTHSILGIILEELIDYTIYHFDTEEKYMLKYNYPHMQTHVKEHNDLRSKVRDIKTKHNNNEEIHIEEMIKFLKDWLVKHILLSDKKFSSYFKN